MAQTTLFLSARSVLDLASALNAFLVAQPLTLWVQNISVSVQDLEQYDGVEVRCCVQYDPVGGIDYGSRFSIAQYTNSRLPLLQQELNTAIAAAVGGLWFTLPLIAIENEARLPQYTSLVLRHAHPNAANNVFYSGVAGVAEDIIRRTDADSPHSVAPNETIIVDVTTAVAEVLLPDATVNKGRKVRVVRFSTEAIVFNALTVNPLVVGQLINDDAGHTPFAITGNDDAYTFISDGIGWWVIGQALGASFP